MIIKCYRSATFLDVFVSVCVCVYALCYLVFFISGAGLSDSLQYKQLERMKSISIHAHIHSYTYTKLWTRQWNQHGRFCRFFLMLLTNVYQTVVQLFPAKPFRWNINGQMPVIWLNWLKINIKTKPKTENTNK